MRAMPEPSSIKLGFMPLSDCAPLVVAHELGFFKQHGINVALQKQNSWATMRDKLHSGVLDAAQLLAPMPLASNLKLGSPAAPVRSIAVLSQQGNGITLSQELIHEIAQLQGKAVSDLSLPLRAEQLLPVINKRRNSSGEQSYKLRFATVFPFSCHYYQLINWLEAGQIARSDIDIHIIPPVNMALALAAGEIDGFCVGAPWNALAVRQQIGSTVITAPDFWPQMPEKVLGVLQPNLSAHSETFSALCGAIEAATAWLTEIPNRFEAAVMLARPEYLNTSVEVIAPSLLDSCLSFPGASPRTVPGYIQFGANGGCDNAAFTEYLLQSMTRSGQLAHAEIPKAETLQDIYLHASHSGECTNLVCQNEDFA